MVEEKISQEFRFKKHRWNKELFLWRNKAKCIHEEKAQKGLYKFNYIKHFLILASTTTRYISSFAFASLIGITIRTMSSAIGLKTCAIVVGIKKYWSIIQKKKKNRDKIIFSAKFRLNKIEVLISKALIGSNISHNNFFNK